MTDDIRSEDFERRLAHALHAAAPVPSPDVTERLLRSTVRVDQRRSWFASHHLFSAVAAAAVLVMAVMVGLQIGSLLPRTGGPAVGSPSADVLPSTEPAPSSSAESSVSAEPSATVTPVSPSPLAAAALAVQRCENPELGYAVSYPVAWWVQEPARPDPELDPLPGCTYFAPEPVDIGQNASLPAEVAIAFGLAEEPFGNPQQPLEVISSREVEVAGRPATVEEIIWTEDTVFQRQGQRDYGYQISLPNGEVLVAGVSSSAGDYDEEKRVLDQMMETLELSGF